MNRHNKKKREEVNIFKGFNVLALSGSGNSEKYYICINIIYMLYELYSNHLSHNFKITVITKYYIIKNTFWKSTNI